MPWWGNYEFEHESDDCPICQAPDGYCTHTCVECEKCCPDRTNKDGLCQRCANEHEWK